MQSDSSVRYKHTEMHTYVPQNPFKMVHRALLIRALNLETIQMPNNGTMIKERDNPQLHAAT